MLRHPHFLTHLRYFIYGSDLPAPVIEGFEKRVAERPEEFETCPDWAPSLEQRRRCAGTALKKMHVCGFDQRAN